jgi:hypothetical protein
LGGLTVDDSVLYVVGIVGDVQYIFYEGPDVLTGYVRQYFGVGFCHGRRGNPRVVDFSVQRGVIGRAEDNKFRLTLVDMSYGVVDFAESYGVKALSIRYSADTVNISNIKTAVVFPTMRVYGLA